MSTSEAVSPDEAAILVATNRGDVADAIAWLAEDHPMAAETQWPRLLRALVAVADTSEAGVKALRRAVREAARSEVDTSKVVFDYGSLPQPSDFREALVELAARSADGTLSGLTARGVIRAQYANELAVQTLCLAIGVSYSDAKDWFHVGSSSWTENQVSQLLAYLHELLEEPGGSTIPNSVKARAVELMAESNGGWSTIETYIQEGVPYEVLLAQRAVGGVWLAHKNATSSFPNISAADALSAALRERNIDYRRSRTVGGTARQVDLQHLSGINKKQVGLVAVANGQAKFAVAFSSARDGGTARANGDGLMQIPVSDLPFALLLTGPGWSSRPETARLATRFSGFLFTEKTLDDLVDCIEESVT